MYAKKDVSKLNLPEPAKYQRLAIDEWYENNMTVTERTGDPPPPCVYCPYKVVLFCHETCMECAEFVDYAEEYLD